MNGIRMLVQSFKRLYQSGRITEEDIKSRLSSGLISQDEYAYITGGE